MESPGVFHPGNDTQGRFKIRRAGGHPISLADPQPVGKNRPGTTYRDWERWEPERPDAENSLRLLPSGPDRVRESAVRPTPAGHMAGWGAGCKGGWRQTWCRSSRAESRGGRDDSVPAPLDFARDERTPPGDLAHHPRRQPRDVGEHGF